MNSIARQRDTPTRSPFAKQSQPRSPTKPTRLEVGLTLNRVIGTTCQSAPRFDCLSFSNSFAYVAGAAAVLATVDDAFRIEQRFFRANASQTAVTRPSTANGSSTPSALSQDVRNRLGQRAREGSPFSGAFTSEHAESPGSGSGHAKDRVKAATAVTLSKDGKWLAYGETGYRPRVLVFPITDNKSSDQPAHIITEHRFGIHAVSFDDSGDLLATLGVINDGFLYIWSMDQKPGSAVLLASNKCTTVVKQMAWMGRSLVTVGTRFIKVWRPDEISPSSGVDSETSFALSNPGHKPLVGRNTLLADMLDVTFTAVVALSETQAIICSDAGDICLLDDTNKQQRLTRLHSAPFSISAACLSLERDLVAAGTTGEIKHISLESLLSREVPPARSPTPNSRTLLPRNSSHPVVVGALSHGLVIMDSRREINFQVTVSADTELSPRSDAPILAAHSDAILGIRPVASTFPIATAFATWSANGSIIGWKVDSSSSFVLRAPLDQLDDASEWVNELRTVSLFPAMPLVVTGDRYGVLRVLSADSGTCLLDVRAHANEITDVDICVVGNETFIATASRDRTVQLFSWKSDALELTQTLDEHSSAVTKVVFADQGRLLLSCSADRTIVIRDRIDSEPGGPSLYGVTRTVSLKAAPTALVFTRNAENILVSAADRTINTVHLQSGRITSSFKAGDNDGGDPVALSSVVQIAPESGPVLIAGVSSADKSIRIYTEDGMLMARDWGHTEGVTAIALLEGRALDGVADEPRLVTTAADGTIFIWSIKSRAPLALPGSSNDDVFTALPSGSPLSRPPLRKVISSTEMSRLRRSMVSPTNEDESSDPAGVKSPPVGGLRKQRSQLNLAQAPKLNMSTTRASSTEPHMSPISRVRSPSPTRSLHSASRSPSRSPERTPRRRLSHMETKRNDSITSPHKLDPQMVLLPHGHDTKTSVCREPSKDPESPTDAAVLRTKQTTELMAQLNAFRTKLEQPTEGSEEFGVEEGLVTEIEALLRAVKLRQSGQKRPTEAEGAVSTETHMHKVEAANGEGLSAVDERSGE